MNENTETIYSDERAYLFPNAARYLRLYPMANSNFAHRAGVSDDIFDAFLEGKEGITAIELIRALELAGSISYNAMFYPALIYLNPKRWKHRMMVENMKHATDTFFEMVEDYPEERKYWQMAGYQDDFKAWYDCFEKGEATYSGYKARIAIVFRMRDALLAQIDSNEEEKKPMRTCSIPIQ